ncbi:copper chaperone PCu(A)C [Pseudidiomarina aestuarii]|uniref:copper chaperone PCu(A)C n=1 Tax=Pseudidiomarina aestuarii TaxID=624146 RepID=UPI003A976FD6
MKRFGWIAAMLWLASPWALAADVEISNAWIKESIPGTENGAGYLTLTNVGTTAITLTGAATEAARAAEIHEHVMNDGMMRMRRVPELAIDVGETVIFRPGSFHVMMFGVKEPFQVGQEIGLELIFSDGDRKAVTAEVRAIE